MNTPSAAQQAHQDWIVCYNLKQAEERHTGSLWCRCDGHGESHPASVLRCTRARNECVVVTDMGGLVFHAQNCVSRSAHKLVDDGMMAGRRSLYVLRVERSSGMCATYTEQFACI